MDMPLDVPLRELGKIVQDLSPLEFLLRPAISRFSRGTIYRAIRYLLHQTRRQGLLEREMALWGMGRKA